MSPTNSSLPFVMPMVSPSLILKPPNSESRAANVTVPVATFSAAESMAEAFSSAEASGSKLKSAERPCGMVRVGTTIILRSVTSGTACSAARMMFLLFGSTKTVFAGVARTASTMSSVLGFIVWPPLTTCAQPSSSKSARRPSPAATETKPSSSSGETGFKVSFSSLLACAAS